LLAVALELTAALATALVAVEIGLRLLAGHVGYLPLRNASAEFHASADGSAAARSAFEILDTPLPGHPATVARTDINLSHADIVFRGVSLSYPGGGRPALADVSLTVRPGDYVVMTGPSGAGKSSLMALLLRVATPASGAITAGGGDLSQVPADHWLAQIAWVPHSADRGCPQPVGRAAAEDSAGPGVPAADHGPAARRAHRPPRPGRRRGGHDRHRDPDG
jgi:ABC-type transport system involved in cytochrome bd biosynthesis fused ATPase/permease subunit